MEEDNIDQFLHQNQMIEAETQKLFDEILKDLHSSPRYSQQNQIVPIAPDQQHENSNLSGEPQRQRFQEVRNKKLYQDSKIKYTQFMLNIIKTRVQSTEKQLKQLKQRYAELQKSHDQKSSKLVKQIQDVFESQLEKEQMLVKISQIIGTPKQKSDELTQWKKDVANHRKIFTKYNTIMVQYHPFAQQNIFSFLLSVNSEFQFNLQKHIDSLKSMHQKVKIVDEILPLKTLLENLSITNSQKINHLYELKYLSSDRSDLSKDILQLLLIKKADDVGYVFTNLIAEKQKQLNRRYQSEIEVLKGILQKSIRIGTSRFQQLQEKLQKVFRGCRVEAGNEEILSIEEMDEKMKKGVQRVEKVIQERVKNYNARKTYFKLTSGIQ